MTIVWIYLGSLLTFLVVDAVWLTTVMRPLFERHVGALLRPEIQLGAAAGFYLLYIVGILYFCTMPALKENALGLALFNAAILGFLAYGTYEFTNMTTLRGWTWTMVISDTAWGMFLTTVTAGAGFAIGRALN
ncbi:MAG: DUF2177 family protein [Pseudomonadota bacterium]